MGRAQELCILLDLYWSRMNLGHIPIYFTAGLSQKANFFYKLFINWTNQKIKQTFVKRYWLKLYLLLFCVSCGRLSARERWIVASSLSLSPDVWSPVIYGWQPCAAVISCFPPFSSHTRRRYTRDGLGICLSLHTSVHGIAPTLKSKALRCCSPHRACFTPVSPLPFLARRRVPS